MHEMGVKDPLPRCAPRPVVRCHGAVPRAQGQGHWVEQRAPVTARVHPRLGLPACCHTSPGDPSLETGVPGNRHRQLGKLGPHAHPLRGVEQDHSSRRAPGLHGGREGWLLMTLWGRQATHRQGSDGSEATRALTWKSLGASLAC